MRDVGQKKKGLPWWDLINGHHHNTFTVRNGYCGLPSEGLLSDHTT